MSLLHLLTVADSLQTPKTGPNRFRMAQQSLPKFAPAKNPISLRPSSMAKAEILTGETGSLFDPRPDPAPAASKKTNAVIETVEMEASPFRPGVSKEKTGGRAVESPVRQDSSNATPRSRSHRIFREAAWLRRRPSGTREREVQAEWTLERVKVIRNDLSDSDLEVVAARREEAKAGPFTLEAPNAKRTLAGVGWLRLAGRLIGLGRSQP